MHAMLLTVGFWLLVGSSLCSVGPTNRGCIKWSLSGANVCCEICHPGHKLVQKCGPDPMKLCSPCEPKEFMVFPEDRVCKKCTVCVDPLVQVRACTATSDTQCGCVEGLTCGNKMCSYCVKKCDRGQEPTEKRSCRPCPSGTFNNQTHQKCEPWSTKCPYPDQIMVSKGDVFNDIQCEVSLSGVRSSWPVSGDGKQFWLLVLSLLISTVLTALAIIAIIIGIVKIQKRKMKMTITKTPIIRTPTDDPRTLIAIECSFHEAEEEQGSSSELLVSRPLQGDSG